nr:type IV secretory system conjugative DNA transfer family protein [Pseudomonas luteola]
MKFTTVAFSLLFILSAHSALAASQETAVSADEAMAEIKQKARETPTADMSDDKRAELTKQQLMSEAGHNYGVQLGRYNHWLALIDAMDRTAIKLDQAFPFGRLYLRNGTLQPPILDAGEDYRSIEDEGRLRRLVKQNYRTLVQARFKNAPMTWRDFMLPDDLAKPPLPRETMLPQNSPQTELWDRAMRSGMEQGRQMARDECDLRTEALQRAFRGLLLYRFLARQGMVEPPKVIERKPGEVITNQKGDELLVGVQEEVISQDAYFVAEPGRWKPIDYGFVEPGERR